MHTYIYNIYMDIYIYIFTHSKRKKTEPPLALSD